MAGGPVVMAARPVFRIGPGPAVVAFGVLVVSLLWAAAIWHIRQDRNQALRAAESDVANLAQVFDVHVQRTIAGLDQTLLFLKAEYQRDPARFDLHGAIAHSTATHGVAVQIGLVDADGLLVDSTVPGFSRIDLADREHISVHRSPHVGLFVSKPVLGRASGKWSIQLTRRLDHPDGRLAGILVISLGTGYLTDVYRSVDVGPHGSVVLLGQDGVVRAAIDSGDVHVGSAIDDPALVEQIFSTRIGRQRLDGPLGREPRISAFRTLPDQPLAVVVGRAESDVLAQFADSRDMDLTVCLAVTIILTACLAMVYRLVHRQETTSRDLEAKKTELVASRERLKRYVTDLERIAEVAAHDLQEPLRRVVAYTQLLARHAEDALDDEGRGYVAQVVAGAQRMRKLVRDLEAYVAVDHLPDVDALTPAGDAVRTATERLAEPIRRAGALIKVDSLPEVAADNRSLTEVFAQLLDNAVRYRSPYRRPMIDVSARRDGNLALFAVRDNGVGIEEPSRARLFEIFHRLRGIDGQDGTGIGLATVRRIVERLGGRIWVDSLPGDGSTFYFTVPLTAQGKRSDQEVQAA